MVHGIDRVVQSDLLIIHDMLEVPTDENLASENCSQCDVHCLDLLRRLRCLPFSREGILDSKTLCKHSIILFLEFTDNCVENCVGCMGQSGLSRTPCGSDLLEASPQGSSNVAEVSGGSGDAWDSRLSVVGADLCLPGGVGLSPPVIVLDRMSLVFERRGVL